MAKLLSSLPVGTKIKDTGTKYNSQPIIWQIMEHGHSGDPSGSTALITEKIITLKCFDAIEASNSDSNRKSYGNNRYLYSNIKQWLNSTASAGNWYAAQHSADAAPTNANVYNNYNEYDQEAGFLSNFSSQFKSALLTTTKKTVKNTATDGGSYESVSGKVFLLSTTEVGLANENSIAEGSIYELFNTSSNRKAYPTAEAVSNSEYTSTSLAATSSWWWYLRTPYSSHSYDVRDVFSDGTLHGAYAYGGNGGIRPACCVSSSILVSDSADSDGVYTIVWNSAPKITTDSTSLGDKNIPFDVKFSITDPDGDKVSATVKLDGATVKSISTVSQGTTYTYTVTGEALASLSIGSHSIVITATDSEGNSASKTITFNRTASKVAISGEDQTLGTIWTVPTYTYSVTDSDGNAVEVVEYVDDEQVRTLSNAQVAGTITFDMSTFDELENEQSHTLKIKATNTDGAVVYRQITFTKIPDKLIFESKPLVTDAPASRITVNVDYDKTNSPEIKVEACNDAKATVQHWEDMTEAFKDKKAHVFANAPDSGYAVAIRVTITKNANTSRVYCNGFGFCFD